MNETYTFGAIVTMLLSALGWLIKTHKEQIADERRRTADEKDRADRLTEIMIRAVGASEALTAALTSRDEVARDARDARERPR